ncbi:hypothetical protein ACKWTF_011190 [Chironomus riparius]
MENYSSQLSNVFDHFASSNNGNFQYNIEVYDFKYQLWNLLKSIVVFVDSIEDFVIFSHMHQVFHNSYELIIIIVFIRNLTFVDFSKFIEINQKTVTLVNPNFYSGYFITNEAETIILSTTEWFRFEACDDQYLKKVNIFDKKLMKWETKLNFEEKFMSFYGCELGLMLPINKDQDLPEHPSGYAQFDTKNDTFRVHGVVPLIFEIAAQYHNFSDVHIPAFMSVNWFDKTRNSYNDLKLLENSSVSNLYFELIGSDYLHIFEFNLQSSMDVTNKKIQIFIRKIDDYSQLDILCFIFAPQTWILLSLSTLLICLVVYFTNKMVKNKSNLHFKHTVVTSTWIVFAILFGMPQKRLSKKKWMRFILMAFVALCLFFRMSFQSGLFGFMTKKLERQPFKTIDNLIDNGYEFYAVDQTPYFIIDPYSISKSKQRPNITKVDVFAFQELLTTQQQNSSDKIALFMDNFIQESTNFDRFRNEWNPIEEDVSINQVFVFKSSTYYLLITTIDNLITNGIIKYLIDRLDDAHWMSRKTELVPKILDLWDFIYCFGIYLVLCIMSIIAFIIELKRPPEYVPDHRKLKFAKVHPTDDEGIRDHIQLKKKFINHFQIKHSSQEQPASIKLAAVELSLAPMEYPCSSLPLKDF